MTASMKYLNLNIGLRALTCSYIPYGGILSYINVQQIHNSVQICKWIGTGSRGIELSIHETRKTQGQILSEFHAWIRDYLVSTHYTVLQGESAKMKCEIVKHSFVFF